MSLLLDEQADLLAEFITESTEHLSTAEDRLLQLEEAPDNPGLIRELMRIFHTIKGNSGYFGLREVTDLAHRLEALLTAVQQGRAVVDEAAMAELLAGVDRLKALLSQAAAAGSADGGTAPAVVEAADGEEQEGEAQDRYLLFKVGDLHMALPLDQVIEVTRPMPVTRLPYVRRDVVGVVNLRGLIVPLVDLEQRLWGRPGMAHARHLVVVPWNRGRIALSVRQVVAVSTIHADTTGGSKGRGLGADNIVLHQGYAVALLNLREVLSGGSVGR